MVEGSGEGAQPLPRKFFDFRAQNGEISCILDAIFTIWLPVLHTN